MASKVLVETGSPLMAKHLPLPLTEDVSSRGRLRVRGPSTRIGERNQNNRLYPESVWDKNLSEGSEFSRRVKNRQALGELEHPEGGNTRLHQVSHLIERAWKQHLSESEAAKYCVPAGKYVMLESLILNTPQGKILKELFEVGVPVGVSSRGRGNTVVVDGSEVVQDDYELSTYDYVENPSVKEARHRPLKEQGEAPPPPSPEKTGVVGQIDEPEPEPELIPGGPGPTNPELLRQAEELVRSMEDAISTDEKDSADIAELFSQALDVLDQMGSSSSPPDAKLRGQILTLSHVLVRKIEGGKSKKGEESEKKEKPEKGSEPEEKGSGEEEESEGKEKILPAEKVEAVVGGTMDDLVKQMVKERKPQDGTVFRGEIENTLKRFGHKSEESKVSDLASAMRRNGYSVKETEYGKPPRSMTASERNDLMSADAKDVIIALAERHNKLKAEIESLKDAVPKAKFESLKKLAMNLVEKAKKSQTQVDEMTKRYEAAKKLIHGLTERAKKLMVAQTVNEMLQKAPELVPFKSMLVECTSNEDLQKKAKQCLEAAAGTNGRGRTELPPLTEETVRQTVRESKKSSNPSNLMSMVAKRC